MKLTDGHLLPTSKAYNNFTILQKGVQYGHLFFMSLLIQNGLLEN